MNIPMLKQFADRREIRSLVADIQEARKESVLLRTQINTIAKSLLEKKVILSKQIIRSGATVQKSERITNPEHVFLADLQSEPVKAYYLDLEKAIEESGFPNMEGRCPALLAEHRVIDLENRLLLQAAEYLDPAFAAITRMEHRREAISLITGLVEKRPVPGPITSGNHLLPGT